MSLLDNFVFAEIIQHRCELLPLRAFCSAIFPQKYYADLGQSGFITRFKRYGHIPYLLCSKVQNTFRSRFYQSLQVRQTLLTGSARLNSGAIAYSDHTATNPGLAQNSARPLAHCSYWRLTVALLRIRRWLPSLLRGVATQTNL